MTPWMVWRFHDRSSYWRAVAWGYRVVADCSCELLRPRNTPGRWSLAEQHITHIFRLQLRSPSPHQPAHNPPVVGRSLLVGRMFSTRCPGRCTAPRPPKWASRQTSNRATGQIRRVGVVCLRCYAALKSESVRKELVGRLPAAGVESPQTSHWHAPCQLGWGLLARKCSTEGIPPFRLLPTNTAALEQPLGAMVAAYP